VWARTAGLKGGPAAAGGLVGPLRLFCFALLVQEVSSLVWPLVYQSGFVSLKRKKNIAKKEEEEISHVFVRPLQVQIK
jgi:parvulin-like peptidyl-prolyl isomerase